MLVIAEKYCEADKFFFLVFCGIIPQIIFTVKNRHLYKNWSEFNASSVNELRFDNRCF